MNEIKEKVLHWLEKEESAFGRLDDLWRDKIDTTGATTVRELFERYEKEQGPLSTDDLKDLLRDLAYVHITCRVFPQTGSTSSTGLLFGNSVASTLEGSSSNAATGGAQSSPSRVMVTGRDRLRVPSKPSSHDWCPEMTSGTMEELVQNMRAENERLKIKVQQLEEALERERAKNIHCQHLARNLQQEVEAKDHELRTRNEVMRVVRDELRESKRTLEEEKLARKKLELTLQQCAERHDEKFQELRRENEFLVDRVRKLQEQLEFERSHREQDRAEFQRQLDQHGQHLQQVERALEERYARHQQPETRTWIIQRNEVVPSDNVLGSGSWGIVRQGTFRGSPVAIKELHSVILSPHNRRLFEREMEIASRCRHLNIVQLMGATSDDQPPLLVTELLDGNLRQLLERRPLIRGEIVSLALDVARGLNFMHCSHPPIVHRDVKSDNVLLKRGDKSWIAKLSDFGTANFRRRVMTPNQGTPLYSAPESSTAQHSELVDVYSFGLLLLEMCIREYPVPDQLADQIKHVPCPRLKELIRCCVQQVPERRPGMTEVIEFLTQLME